MQMQYCYVGRLIPFASPSLLKNALCVQHKGRNIRGTTLIPLVQYERPLILNAN